MCVLCEKNLGLDRFLLSQSNFAKIPGTLASGNFSPLLRFFNTKSAFLIVLFFLMTTKVIISELNCDNRREKKISLGIKNFKIYAISHLSSLRSIQSLFLLIFSVWSISLMDNQHQQQQKKLRRQKKMKKN